jgi:outer membrane lipoprotein LolB
MRIHHLLSLIFLVALTSCATIPSFKQPAPQNQSITWDNRVSTLSNIQNWDLKGLIAIRTNKDAVSANWQWQQKANHTYTISLFGPLGANSLQLTGEPNHVLLETSDGKKFTANSPESLLEQQGWRLPVSHLYYWIRGLPAPNIPAQKNFDAYNHLTTLIQQGWRIEYPRYLSIHNIDLPGKIVLTNAELNVKIIINQWNIK